MYGGCTKDVRRLRGAGSHLSFEFKFGSGTGTRTLNLAVNSRLLYRLSYPGTDVEF
jgi:hypothetical protein